MLALMMLFVPTGAASTYSLGEGPVADALLDVAHHATVATFGGELGDRGTTESAVMGCTTTCTLGFATVDYESIGSDESWTVEYDGGPYDGDVLAWTEFGNGDTELYLSTDNLSWNQFVDDTSTMVTVENGNGDVLEVIGYGVVAMPCPPVDGFVEWWPGGWEVWSPVISNGMVQSILNGYFVEWIPNN